MMNKDFWVTSEAICQCIFKSEEVTSENTWQITSQVTLKKSRHKWP